MGGNVTRELVKQRVGGGGGERIKLRQEAEAPES